MKTVRIRQKIKAFLSERPRNTAEILEHINTTMRHCAEYTYTNKFYFFQLKLGLNPRKIQLIWNYCSECMFATWEWEYLRRLFINGTNPQVSTYLHPIKKESLHPLLFWPEKLSLDCHIIPLLIREDVNQNSSKIY